MSTLSNLNSYKRTMNGIQSFDDGMGSTMENGSIVCNSFATDDLIVEDLNSSSITNSGSITTDTLNSTTGTITTLNTPTIQTSGTLNLTGSAIILNGTQSDTRTYISNYNNNSLELGTNNNLAYVDFHSSNTTTNYDSRISSQGIGEMSILSNSLKMYTNAGITTYSDSFNLLPSIGSGGSSTLTAQILNATTMNNTGTITSSIGNINTINSYNIGTDSIAANSGTIISLASTTLNTTTINNAGTTTSNILTATTSGTIPTLNSTTINNSGTTTSNILTATTSGTIPTLNSTTINNSGTTTSNILTATTSGTIPTLNSTTVNTTNINITGSISVPTISTTSATFQNIQPIANSTTTNLYTNNTGDLNVGGSGTLKLQGSSLNNTTSLNNLCINPANNNYNIKASTTIGSNYAQLKFKSSNSTNDFDTSITSAGGTSGTNGTGNLLLNADTIRINGNVYFENFIATQTIGSKTFNTTYQNFGTSAIFVSVTATSGSAAVMYAKTDSTGTPSTVVARAVLYINQDVQMFFIVLPQNKYRVDTTGTGASLLYWTEWS